MKKGLSSSSPLSPDKLAYLIYIHIYIYLIDNNPIWLIFIVGDEEEVIKIINIESPPPSSINALTSEESNVLFVDDEDKEELGFN